MVTILIISVVSRVVGMLSRAQLLPMAGWHHTCTVTVTLTCTTAYVHAGHEHVELHGMLDIPQVNFVEDSCAFNMHFTNWFSDRISSPTVGGAQTGFSPLGQPLIATLRALYQRRECRLLLSKQSLGEHLHCL